MSIYVSSGKSWDHDFLLDLYCCHLTWISVLELWPFAYSYFHRLWKSFVLYSLSIFLWEHYSLLRDGQTRLSLIIRTLRFSMPCNRFFYIFFMYGSITKWQKEFFKPWQRSNKLIITLFFYFQISLWLFCLPFTSSYLVRSTWPHQSYFMLDCS